MFYLFGPLKYKIQRHDTRLQHEGTVSDIQYPAAIYARTQDQPDSLR